MSTQSNPAYLPVGGPTKRRMYLSLAVIAAAVSVAVLRSAGEDTLVLVSPGAVHAGSTVDMPVTLKTSSKNLSALEWQISASPDLSFEATSSLSGKKVQCYKQHCMLYGGQGPISSGVIATLKIHLPSTPSADVSIVLRDVLGATSDAASRKIGDASLKLKVQP